MRSEVRIIKKLLFLIFISRIIFASEYDPKDIIDKCILSYLKVKDFTCIFKFTEVIDNKTYKNDNFLLKFKKTECFYMKNNNENPSSEYLYVQGKYNNEVVVHLGGNLQFIKLSIKPFGYLVKKRHRHPIYDSDIGRIIDLIKKNFDKSNKNKEGTISFEKEEILDNRKTLFFKAVFPKKGYYGHIIFINIDEELMLPIKIVTYDWNKNLVEDYYYSDLKINVGLNDINFETTNPNYNF